MDSRWVPFASVGRHFAYKLYSKSYLHLRVLLKIHAWFLLVCFSTFSPPWLKEGKKIQKLIRSLKDVWNSRWLEDSEAYCWFSHDVTKIQTTKLLSLLRFYFHGVLEQLKTNFQTNFRFKRVLGFVIEYAWISKLLRDAAFTWRPRELSFRLKKRLFSRNFAI